MRNMNIRLLASAARTATVTLNSADPVLPASRQLPINRRHAGLALVLRVSAASGTGGLTVKIQEYDKQSGQVVDLLADGAAITTTGTFAFYLHPSTGAASGGVRAAASRQLPPYWQVQVVHGDASSYTYSLEGELLR